MHSTDPQYPGFFFFSRFEPHGVTQLPWITIAVLSLCLRLQPKQSMPPFLDLCKSRLCQMKPTPQTCFMASRNQNLGTQSPSTVACATKCGQRLQLLLPRVAKILDSQIGLWSHVPLCRPCHPPICKTMKFCGPPLSHTPLGDPVMCRYR